MIRIRDLSVQFGGIRPLDGLDADLSAPIVGLIGPNGAGKTTLLNVLSGFVRPVRGRVELDGTSLLELSPVRRARLGLRRVFQQEMLVETLSAWDNMQSLADHAPVAVPPTAIAAALSFVGLTPKSRVPARELSLLERRLVEIGRGVLGGARVLLLDEPGAGLNEEESLVLRRVIVELPKAYDVQVVLIDHDAALIASTCVETLVLDFGRRLALGPTAAVLDDPAVRQAYLGADP